jgi:hypothetical protein
VLRSLSIHEDGNTPPDEDFDARQRLEIEHRGGSLEETQRTDELVSSEADGVASGGETTWQLLDPKVLATLGTFGIGFVLAARLQELGPFKFNEGIPPELAQVVRASFQLPSS